MAIVKGRKKIAHAYILDQEVAGNKTICLIGSKLPHERVLPGRVQRFARGNAPIRKMKLGARRPKDDFDDSLSKCS
jgi:hypothetical protein